MKLTPREKDKLLIAMAAEVARKRLARGVKLNHPEAIAIITDAVVEGARDGRSVADMMEAGASCALSWRRRLLGPCTHQAFPEQAVSLRSLAGRWPAGQWHRRLTQQSVAARR